MKFYKLLKIINRFCHNRTIFFMSLRWARQRIEEKKKKKNNSFTKDGQTDMYVSENVKI